MENEGSTPLFASHAPRRVPSLLVLLKCATLLKRAQIFIKRVFYISTLSYCSKLPVP